MLIESIAFDAGLPEPGTSCASTSMQRPVATSQRSLNAQDRPAHTRASSSRTVAA